MQVEKNFADPFLRDDQQYKTHIFDIKVYASTDYLISKNQMK